MSVYEDFLISLYKYLLEVEDYNNNIIKKHARKLDQLGEFSFSCKVHKIKNSNLSINLNDAIETITTASNQWNLKIGKYTLVNDTIHLYLDRFSTIHKVLECISNEGTLYGTHKLNFVGNITVHTNLIDENLCNINLSQLRVVLLNKVINRLLNYQVCINNTDPIDIYLTHCGTPRTATSKTIICAPVTSALSNEHALSAIDLYNKRTIDMRLMAEHKYGLRITSKPGWRDIFRKLGEAAVTIELLQIKPNHAIVCNFKDFASSCSKGASFILYNCARLATLLKEFQRKVDEKMYPPLPELKNIDVTLLIEPEEWEITFVYLLQYPLILFDCIKDILDSNVKIHNLCHFLANMCSTFSVYYQRVRILREPRAHLYPVLHARIYLIKAIETVLHNGLHILGIEPVKQM